LLRAKFNLILARKAFGRHLLDRQEIGMTSGSAVYGGAFAPDGRAHAPNE
jgi:hypothetical protein